MSARHLMTRRVGSALALILPLISGAGAVAPDYERATALEPAKYKELKDWKPASPGVAASQTDIDGGLHSVEVEAARATFDQSAASGTANAPLERVPIGWTHPIDKNPLENNKLEHVLMRHRIYPMS